MLKLALLTCKVHHCIEPHISTHKLSTTSLRLLRPLERYLLIVNDKVHLCIAEPWLCNLLQLEVGNAETITISLCLTYISNAKKPKFSPGERFKIRMKCF